MTIAAAVMRVEYRRTLADIAPAAGRRRVAGLTMDDPREMSDAETARLMRAIAERRDRAAFASLFRLYAGRVKAWIMRSGATPELAEEIAQETLLTVWRKAGLYRPERASVSAWVFAIARNLRVDRARRDQRARQQMQQEAIEEEDPETPDGLLDVAEREARVRAAIDTLSADQLSVVRLSFFEGKPHALIADTLGIPLGTVKSRLRLAMARLRNLLEDLT
jgi:RNA polymerase sigma-70 factor (ECF subfamily)